MSFLATTGSVAPFIGLMGTVWGVMVSFVNIGAQGSATLVVVAPGIAEALIATIAGLAAAIPSVIGYNHCLGRLREIGQRAPRPSRASSSTAASGRSSVMLRPGAARPPMAEINVTPFVDVVLVLLIIFMVTAPFLQGGLEIDLPKVATKGLDVHEGLIVSIRRDLTLAVGETVVPQPPASRTRSSARARPSARCSSRPTRPCRTARSSTYIARMRRAGVVAARPGDAAGGGAAE